MPSSNARAGTPPFGLSVEPITSGNTIGLLATAPGVFWSNQNPSNSIVFATSDVEFITGFYAAAADG